MRLDLGPVQNGLVTTYRAHVGAGCHVEASKPKWKKKTPRETTPVNMLVFVPLVGKHVCGQKMPSLQTEEGMH